MFGFYILFPAAPGTTTSVGFFARQVYPTILFQKIKSCVFIGIWILRY